MDLSPSPTNAIPSDWTATERSRAQTRALLMALSRKRDWYFVLRPRPTLVEAIVTLGLRPIAEAATRLHRWRRLEWIQYAELGRWMADRTGDPIADELVRYADGAANVRAPRVWPFIVCAIAILVTLAIVSRGNWRMLLATVFAPAWQPIWSATWAPLMCGYAFVLAFAWVSLLTLLIRHQASVVVWLTRCAVLLAAHDKRPIVLVRTATPLWTLGLAILIGSVFAPWIGAMLVVIGAQNRYIIATRAARLAFIERMLEWMDRSGLPVEFDVEEMAPDAVAATLA